MARKSDGSVYIDTLVDTSGFDKGVKSIKNQMGGLGSAVSKLGGVIAAAFAVKQLVQFGKSAIQLGSDLQEVQNVVDVTFSSMSDKVNEFAKGAAEAAGLSETMAKRYMGTFGAMAKAFGFAESESFNMSAALTQLAGDVASFYNLTQDEAYTKLKSVFTGETETLKDLGVVMTQSALDSYAMAKGFGKTTKQMSEQEKVALRYSFVMDQLSAAQGDFARTSDSWANQTKILSLNFDSFKANIGQALIAIFTPFLQVINQIVAKMSELSSKFLTFVQLITGRGASGGGSPGAALGEIASGYDDVTDATNQAAKAQKNYTSGLDELNILSTENSGGSSAGGVSISPMVPEETKTNNALLESTNTIFDKILDVLENIKNRLSEIADIFKKGFLKGINNAIDRIDVFKDSFDSIKESASKIFDGDLFGSFNEMVDKIAHSFGQITGAFTSVGLSIGENLLGGLADYLSSGKDRIKQFIINMFDIASETTTLIGNFYEAIAYIFEAVTSEAGKKVTSDIIGIFTEAFMGITQQSGMLFANITKVITQPFVNAKEPIRQAAEDLLDGLSYVTTFLKEVITDINDFIMQVYENIIGPVFDNIVLRLTELLENHLMPFFTQTGELLGAAGELLLLLWESILSPLIGWIIENILPVVIPIIDTIVNSIKIAVGFITDCISGLMQMLTGIIKFITGVFTADWKKAWEGVKDIFKGIINKMASVIEYFINSSINMINGLISGINKLTNTVGIPSIPLIPNINIPKLATGAVIPPNAPFLAMLGDQKSGNNIEAPEDLIRKIVREETSGVGALVPYLEELIRYTKETAEKELVIGDRDIAKANIRGQRAIGHSLITEG